MSSDTYRVAVEKKTGATLELRVTDNIYDAKSPDGAPPLSLAFFVMAACGEAPAGGALRTALVAAKACDADGSVLSEPAFVKAANKLVRSGALVEVKQRNQGLFEIEFSDASLVTNFRKGTKFRTTAYDLGPSTFAKAWKKLAPPLANIVKLEPDTDASSIRVMLINSGYDDVIFGVDQRHPRRRSVAGGALRDELQRKGGGGRTSQDEGVAPDAATRSFVGAVLRSLSKRDDALLLWKTERPGSLIKRIHANGTFVQPNGDRFDAFVITFKDWVEPEERGKPWQIERTIIGPIKKKKIARVPLDA
jgi:hypothetical protein